MGAREGLANMFDFISQYAGNYGLLKQKAKATAESNDLEEQNKLMRGMKEYLMWTNPDDPTRKLLESKYPELTGKIPFGKMTIPQFLNVKSGGVGGATGFGMFDRPSGGVVEAPEDWK